MAGVDDLPAVVLVVLVAAGDDDRLSAGGARAGDTCLNRAVNPGGRDLPAASEDRAELDSRNLPDVHVGLPGLHGGVTNVEPQRGEPLPEVDAGRLDATLTMRAWIEGAAVALEAIHDEPAPVDLDR